MNRLFILAFNAEAIEPDLISDFLNKSQEIQSHFTIRHGLILISYSGTARQLYEILEQVVGANKVFIHVLSSDKNAYWGFMDDEFWTWLKTNTPKTKRRINNRKYNNLYNHFRTHKADEFPKNLFEQQKISYL